MLEIPKEYMKEINKIIWIIKEEGCQEAYIFGSLARGEQTNSSDIDIAVKGMKPDKFFKVYGKLISSIEHNVDLVDIDDGSDFSKLIMAKGEMMRVL